MTISPNTPERAAELRQICGGASGILLVMDANCALCSASARRIARRDHRDVVRITAAQSQLGRRLLAEQGLDPADPESWLMIDLETGETRTQLEAAIALGRRLGGLWAAARLLSVPPRRARDWIYRRIARNRYRLFGNGDLCGLPDPELRRRLVGGDEWSPK